MKKVLTFLAVCGIACFASAANFIWGFNGYDYSDHDGNSLENGTAFFYLGTVSASSSEFNIGTATLITSAGFDENGWVYGNEDFENLSSSDLVTSTAEGQAFTLILLENSGVTTLDGYEGYYTIYTGTSEEGSIPGASVTKYGMFLDSSDGVQTSSYMSVPEPTSGLLLLLGMAGLALKRKIA